MWRATSVWLIAILGVCSLGSQQPPPDPVDVLRRATEALERLHAVRYDARYTRGTVLSDEIVAVQGSVTFVRDTGTDAARLRVQAEIYTSFRPDRARIEATCDGTRWLFVDPKAKSFASGPDRAVGGQAGREALHLVAAELLDPTLLLRAVESTRIRHEGFTTLSNSRCHKIFTESHDGTEQTTWYISTDGFLPLRIERTDAATSDRVSSQLTFMGLRVDPSIQGESFQTTPPQGFREFARLPSPVDWPVGLAEKKHLKSAVELVSLADSEAPVIDRFNRYQNKLRVVVLLAPS